MRLEIRLILPPRERYSVEPEIIEFGFDLEELTGDCGSDLEKDYFECNTILTDEEIEELANLLELIDEEKNKQSEPLRADHFEDEDWLNLDF